jgi:ubiquinol-cytochrome c reductase cytochrome b subunit
MFGSLLILLVLPLTDVSRIRGMSFRPAMKFFFWAFVVNFFILMWIGSQHPNTPFVEIGQIATAFYFAWFLIIVPVIGLLENTLMDIATENNNLSPLVITRLPIQSPPYLAFPFLYAYRPLLYRF